MATELPAQIAETSTSFRPLKQVEAGELEVSYADAGPSDGPAVVLLNGWPYDVHSYLEVVPLLAARGYRSIVPHLRGYGATRFLSTVTPRNAQQPVLALDAIALLDALSIEQAVVAGFDTPDLRCGQSAPRRFFQ